MCFYWIKLAVPYDRSGLKAYLSLTLNLGHHILIYKSSSGGYILLLEHLFARQVYD